MRICLRVKLWGNYDTFLGLKKIKLQSKGFFLSVPDYATLGESKEVCECVEITVEFFFM